MLGGSAANALGRRFPTLSAAPPAADDTPRGRRLRTMRRLAQTVLLSVMMTLTPKVAPDIWSSVLALWFLAFIGLRLAASLMPRRSVRTRHASPIVVCRSTR